MDPVVVDLGWHVGGIEVGRGPLGDEAAGALCGLRTREEVVGAVEGDERFRVAELPVDPLGVADVDGLVVGGVEQENGLRQLRQVGLRSVGGEVREEFAGDLDVAAGEGDGDASLGLGIADPVAEAEHGVGDVVGGGEGGHGPDGIDLLGRAQGRSPAEGVAEQELRCLVLGGQPRGGGEEFLDVGGEAELGEVETQARDAVGRECLAHPGGCGTWRVQVKQCAKIAYATGGVSGRSMVPDSSTPRAEGNVTLTDCMLTRVLGWWHGF